MTILLFLVDTSASMAQKNYMGITALDTAKALVADLIKQRARDVHARQGDRYMLLTTEEFPLCVKTGWREGNAVLTEQLKALRPCGRHPLKQGIISAFQFVNLNRASSGIDNYGHGRFPLYQEPVVIITISDVNSMADLPNDLELTNKLRSAADTAMSRPPPPGIELTEELYRWDQRLFSVVLRMGARAPPEPRIGSVLPLDTEPGVAQRICAGTGGRSFAMISHRQQSALVEKLVSMIQINGVVVRFEFPALGILPRNGQYQENGEMAAGRKEEVAAENLRESLKSKPMTLVFTRNRQQQTHWPIPEAYWPESVQAGSMLPARKAHPLLTIAVKPSEVLLVQEFPFDKYEVEAGPLVDYIKDRTAELAISHPNASFGWEVFVTNSYKLPGPGRPFGYLKAASNGSVVNLFLMPYDYRSLLRLVEEQKADPRWRAHPDWKRRLEGYVESCPGYYKNTLKKALARLKISGGTLDEPTAQLYLPPILHYLAKCKNVGKEEHDARNTEIGLRLRAPPRPPTYVIGVEKRPSIPEPKNFRIESEEKKKKGKEDGVKKKRGARGLPMPSRATSPFEDEELPNDPDAADGTGPSTSEPVPNLVLDLSTAGPSDSIYHNPFNIRRTQIIQMLPRVRINMEQQLADSSIPALEGGLPGTACKLQTAYDLHSLPVSQMGNYDEYVKKLEKIGAGPMREVESRAVREHTFGNPFKKDKKGISVDEVGEALPSTSKETGGMSKQDRRKMESTRPPRRKAGPLGAISMMNWRERRRSISAASSVASDLSHVTDDLSEELAAVEFSSSNGGPSSPADGLDIEMVAAFSKIKQPEEPPPVETPPATPPLPASTPPTTNGVRSPSKDSGFADFGLEDEADDDDVQEVHSGPAPKKPRLASASDDILVVGVKAATRNGSAIPLVKKDGRVRPPAPSRPALTTEQIRPVKSRVCSIVRQILQDNKLIAELDPVFASLPLPSRKIIIRFARDESRRFKKRKLTEMLQKRLDDMEVTNGS